MKEEEEIRQRIDFLSKEGGGEKAKTGLVIK